MTRRHGILFLLAAGLSGWAYGRIHGESLNMTTGLVFLAAVCASAWFLGEVAIATVPACRRRRTEVRLLTATSTVLLFGLEVGLRFAVDELSTWFERNGNPEYVSHYDQVKPGWFHLHPSNLEMRWSSLEFTHQRYTNSLGLSEIELDTARVPDEFRVIAIGDSFTEGVGTTQDSTWVKAAERHLRAALPDRTVRVYNAGISGSDAAFGYVLLRERLLVFDPDLVVITTNTTDVSDMIIRGGVDRFEPDGSIVTPTGPAWEWAFAISFICRAVMYGLLDYNWLLIPERQMPERSAQAVDEIRTAIDSITVLGHREGFAVLAVVHPLAWETANDAWSYGFDSLVDDLERGEDPPVFNLLTHFRTGGVVTPETVWDYYWPVDTHFNPAGYATMGTAIANEVLRRWPAGPSRSR